MEGGNLGVLGYMGGRVVGLKERMRWTLLLSYGCEEDLQMMAPMVRGQVWGGGA